MSISTKLKEFLKDNSNQENELLQRINSLLTRKDVIKLDNDKIDTIRLLALHLENKKEIPVTRLVKFLKS